MVSQSFGFMQEEVLAAFALYLHGLHDGTGGLMKGCSRLFETCLPPQGFLYLGVVLTATVFAMPRDRRAAVTV